MKITNSEFCSLVSAGKNSEEIKFSACTILTDVEWDFGEMENSRIQTLDFFQSGSSNKSNWKSEFGRFINIIIGISISNGLKQCLEKFVIKDCELDQSKAKNILETYTNFI